MKFSILLSCFIFTFVYLTSDSLFAVNLDEKEEAASSTIKIPDYSQKQWFHKTTFNGEVAFAYIRTGAAGARPNGSFMNSSVVMNFNTLIHHNLFTKIQFFPLNKWGMNVGETYIHFKNIWTSGVHKIGFKFGRFETPFGEEYLQRFWHGNLLISDSAAATWGWEHGFEFYGQHGPSGWFVGVGDNVMTGQAFGTTSISSRDGAPGFSYFGKAFSQWTNWFYTSLSYIKGDKSYWPSFWIGNDAFPRAGTTADGAGTATATTSNVTFNSTELDLKFKFDALELAMNSGKLSIKDLNDSKYNRDLSYFSIQPNYFVNDRWYVSARLSSVTAPGGYVLGNNVKGPSYTNMPRKGSVKKYELTSLGFGLTPNPVTKIVFEYTKAALTPEVDGTDLSSGKRDQWGMKIATTF